ncbi:hypothetical protein AB0L40_11905 [Patulibacter sp. NPDC049589]|uniref:hypothetical protein n=1 Tax=Patulibacter sp. NPDC049589 TaxID=3154731 RepID=UPI003445FD01
MQKSTTPPGRARTRRPHRRVVAGSPPLRRFPGQEGFVGATTGEASVILAAVQAALATDGIELRGAARLGAPAGGREPAAVWTAVLAGTLPGMPPTRHVLPCPDHRITTSAPRDVTPRDVI